MSSLTLSEPSEDCSAKIAGIKLVTTFLLEFEDEKLAKKFMKILFEILTASGCTSGKAGSINEDKDKTSVSDRSFIRSIATCSLLRIAENRNYEKNITVEEFQQLSRQTQDVILEVRQEILAQLFSGLKEITRLPLRYLSILVLYATEPDRELLARAKKFLLQLITIRRQTIKQIVDIDSGVLTALLPENALPYVIHLLAHSTYFTTDAPHYINTHKHLTFFLELILVKEDNYPFLIELLQFIKVTEDVQDKKSNNIHVIADLALLILRQKMDRRPFTRKHSGTVYLPPKLYHQPDKGQDQLVDKTYLPMGFQLAKKNKFDALIAEEPEEEVEKTTKKSKVSSPRTSPNKKRKPTTTEGDDEDSIEGMPAFEDIIKKSPTQNKKKKTTGKGKQQKDDDDEEDNDNSESASNKSPSPKKTTRGRPKGSKNVASPLKTPKSAGIKKPTTMKNAKAIEKSNSPAKTKETIKKATTTVAAKKKAKETTNDTTPTKKTNNKNSSPVKKQTLLDDSFLTPPKGGKKTTTGTKGKLQKNEEQSSEASPIKKSSPAKSKKIEQQTNVKKASPNKTKQTAASKKSAVNKENNKPTGKKQTNARGKK